MTTNTTLDAFTLAYIECALWSSVDDNQRPLDANYTVSDISPAALAQIIEDCADFQTANAELLTGLDSAQSGHDFWLTRNHHGAGFWDRGLGAIGTALTAASHPYGSCDLYIGDDGKVYL